MLMFTASTSFPPPPPGGPFPDGGGNIPSRMKYCIYTVYTISTVCQGGGKKFFLGPGAVFGRPAGEGGPAGNSPTCAKRTSVAEGRASRLRPAGGVSPLLATQTALVFRACLCYTVPKGGAGMEQAKFGAVLLAAGNSTRMGGSRSKVLEEAGGQPASAVPGGAGPLPPYRGDLPGVPGARSGGTCSP